MVLKKEVADQIKDLLQKNPQGLSITEIVASVKINRNTAGRYLETLLVSGQVELHRFGMAKIYRISQRVPLSAVLSISSELVVQLDIFLRIVFVNESFCTFVGTDSKDLIGKNIEYTPIALVFDELFVKFIERIREGIAGVEWSGEIEFRSRGIIVNCRVAPTVFDYGRKGVSIVLEDITERKKGERALQESEATARALMNSPTDTVILMDTQGIILDLNETAASKFRKYGDNLVGKRADILLPVEIAKSRWALTTQVVETKQMVRYEDERDGRWYDTVAYPVIVGGEVTRVAMIARDITDRKKSEDALRESEERYRLLVDISPDAVLVHKAGKIIFINPAALKLLGASHTAEIIGKNVIDFIQPEFRAAVRKNIEKDLGGEITPPMELHMVGIDGTHVIVEGRGVKTTINGEAAIQVALRDITERKRSTDALLESEERLRLILDSTDDLVIVQDPEGRYLYFNSAARYGVSGEEMIGSTPFDFIDRESADRIIKRVKKVVRTGQRIREETPIVWKGQTLWFSDSLAPMRNANGTITAVVTISHNITERKHAEMALHESERMYQRLLEQSFDAIAIHKDNKIAFLNERAVEILGASTSEDMIGRSIFEFIHPDSRKNLEDRIRQMAAAPDDPVPVMREKFFRMDGTAATVDVMAMRFNDNGVPAVRVAFREVNSH